jgi:hypothetical protein
MARLWFTLAPHYSFDMKTLLTAVLLLGTVAAPYPANQATLSGGPVVNEIVVRVLNGENDRPIKHETLGSRLGSDRMKSYRTNDNGEVVVIIGGSQARGIQVWLTNFYIDCETYGNDNGQETTFALDEIASKGIVAENRCGRNRANAVPGVLIVYKRKMTRKERRLI